MTNKDVNETAASLLRCIEKGSDTMAHETLCVINTLVGFMTPEQQRAMLGDFIQMAIHRSKA